MPPTKQLQRVRELAVQQAAAYAKEAKAPKTVATYRWAWQAFESWCEETGLIPLPATPATLVAYSAARAQAGDKYATLTLRLAAIHQAHVLRGVLSGRGAPEVKAVLQGIRRTHGVKQDQKLPVSVEQLRMALAEMGTGTSAVRDRAMILVGFAAGFRRGELAGLTRQDLVRERGGYRIHLRRSKTDQQKAGREVVVSRSGRALCPVAALEAWLALLPKEHQWVFSPIDRWGNIANRPLSPRVVASVVKAMVASIGLDPNVYAGHSLRAGCVTAAYLGGATPADIMLKTGHRRVEMVQRYVRALDLFERDVMKDLL